jgi:hypothetical protein
MLCQRWYVISHLLIFILIISHLRHFIARASCVRVVIRSLSLSYIFVMGSLSLSFTIIILCQSVILAYLRYRLGDGLLVSLTDARLT